MQNEHTPDGGREQAEAYRDDSDREEIVVVEEVGVAGFSTDTGLSSDDEASFTGDPASRSAGRSSDIESVASAADGPTGEELPLATGHNAPAPPRPTDRLEADDAPEVGEVGSKLEPMDPRVGTLDDPNNPQQSV